jgi:hypothetical protein
MNGFRGPMWLNGLCVIAGAMVIGGAFLRYRGSSGAKKRLFWLMVIQGALTMGLGILGWF